MIIKKFNAQTEKEAEAMAKEELGQDAIIMNVKTIKPSGLFKMFKKTTVELTAAIDDNIAEKKSVSQSRKFNQSFASSKPDFAEKGINNSLGNSLGKKEKKSSDDIIEEKINTLARLLDQQNQNNGKAEERQFDRGYDSKDTFIRRTGDAGGEGVERFSTRVAPKTYMYEDYERERDNPEKETENKEEENKIVTLVKKQLTDNEVTPEHADEIISELDVSSQSQNLDVILSSVYQKIVLKLGQIESIEIAEEKPRIVFFVGNTGVGKTTTIAKIASKLTLENKVKVAMFSVDTYRIAAIEQIKTYANILSTPMEVVYTPEDMKNYVEKYKDYDIIMVDTAGRSHTNKEQKNDLLDIINSVEEYEKEIYLVLSVTTKYSDLINIAKTYNELFDYKLIFTKLDETKGIGNILNLKMDTGQPLAYVTWGQNVPDDIGEINPQVIAKKLLGGAD